MTGRIAVLRALPGVGDLLCSVPALRAIRLAHPHARVTLLGLTNNRWFVRRFAHVLDDLLVVEGIEGLPEIPPDAKAAERFLRAARARCFDMVLQMHGNGRMTNSLVARLGARRLITPVAYPTDTHEVDRLIAVAAAAGCPHVGRELELPLSRVEHATADRLVQMLPAGDGFVVLHAGASSPQRSWMVGGFAEIGDYLAEHGWMVVATGSAAERDRVRAVIGGMHRSAIDLAGRTSLGVLAAMLMRARLVVTNDTGVSHLSAAVRAPSVVVSGSPEPWRWAPLDRSRHMLVTGTHPPAWPDISQVLEAVDCQLNVALV